MGSCLGGVQFFRYANQAACGGKKFTRGLTAILKSAEFMAPQGYILSLPNKTYPKFAFYRHYYANYARDFNSYPCDAAAKDLAWLISVTLPMLQALHEEYEIL